MSTIKLEKHIRRVQELISRFSGELFESSHALNAILIELQERPLTSDRVQATARSPNLERIKAFSEQANTLVFHLQSIYLLLRHVNASPQTVNDKRVAPEKKPARPSATKVRSLVQKPVAYSVQNTKSSRDALITTKASTIKPTRTKQKNKQKLMRPSGRVLPAQGHGGEKFLTNRWKKHR
jgi:hypothetical protein